MMIPYDQKIKFRERDASRFRMNDTTGLMNGIKRSLEHRREPK